MTIYSVVMPPTTIRNESFQKMDLADKIRCERSFDIYINGVLYFHDPLFPILEFVQYCQKWIQTDQKSFVYESVEYDEAPLLSFIQEEKGYRIQSIWEEFECTALFSSGELHAFINGVISQVLI